MECANNGHTSPWVFSSLHCGLSSTLAFFCLKKGMLSRPMVWNFSRHEIINNIPAIQLYDLHLWPNEAPSQTWKFHQGPTQYLATNSTLKTGIKVVAETSPWDLRTKRHCQTVIDQNPSTIHAPHISKMLESVAFQSLPFIQ